MRIWTLCFLLGIVLLQIFSFLPAKIFILLAFALGLLCAKKLKWFSAVCFGFAWVLWYAHSVSAWSLPHELEGKTITVEGVIASIPEQAEHGNAFLFALHKVQNQSVRSFIKLTAQIPNLHADEKWQFTVHLKQIHGMKNPGGFDYEAWAFQNGIRANGYVLVKQKNNLLANHSYHYVLNRLRQNLKEKMRANLPQSNTAPWIIALALGERDNISPENWQVLRNTGTNHLMAIAGLHIGFLTSFVYFAVSWIWRRIHLSPQNIMFMLRDILSSLMRTIQALPSPRRRGSTPMKQGTVLSMGGSPPTRGWQYDVDEPQKDIPLMHDSALCLKLPAPHAGAIAALLVALIYSALAGFSIPTQRACLMISTGLIMLLLRRRILSWQAWSVALLGVLLLNPLSVLSESFWLSFGSVALIIYGISGRLNPKNLWWKVGRLQWVVSLGLIPLGIWLFQQCSFVALIANAIAIPCVGFFIVPLTLLGCFFLLFSAKIGSLILLSADKILSLLWIVLTYLAHLSWATWYQTVPVFWILCAGCVAVVIFLLPAGMPGRLFGLIWFAPLIFYHAPAPKNGEVFFTLLDVGQGLAQVVQTQQHILIFDTGSKLSDSFDMGESVVVPFLHSIGAKKIDMLVVSHGDNDHIGGSGAVLENFFVQQIKTSVPEKFPPFVATHCLQGESWQWDGVNFAFLYPTLENLQLDNNSSCVLKITNAQQQSILLTGDIEKFAERSLLETEKNNLSADVLIAPHHGSKTSDLNEFIDAVHPNSVLFSVGYRNRFHFPNTEVVAKYRTRNVKTYATDKTGAIQFALENHDRLKLYREQSQHYWND